MTILREEDSHLSRIHGHIGLRLRITVFRDVLLSIVLEVRKVRQRRVAECLRTGDGNLDVNHLDVRLQDGRFLGALRGLREVQEQVLVAEVKDEETPLLISIGTSVTLLGSSFMMG